MAYIKTDWEDGDLITASKLNNIENGLENVSISGTQRQVSGFDQNGNLLPITLGWAQFSDLETPPPFEAGVLTGMTFNEDGSAMYYFQELNSAINADAKENTIPVYGTNGVLKVSDGVSLKDAVNVSQLNALISRIEALENQ